MPLKHTVKELTLKNGAKGLLVNVPDATIMCYSFNFRAGNEFTKNLTIQQTAHILEHMAFKACKEYPSNELFSQEFTKNGAYNNAMTWDSDMSYYGDCAEFEWSRILDLQRQGICEPILTQDLLKAEKRNVREELTGQSTNYSRILYQNVQRAFGSKTFLDPEKIKTIDKVAIGDINEHYKRTHTLKNMRFIVGGNLKNREHKIEDMLNDWQLPKGTSRFEPRILKAKKANLVRIEKKDADSLWFLFSMKINRRLTVKEERALNCLSHILTGTFHSRIFGKARTQGLCYGMGSYVSNNTNNTTDWNFGGRVTLENSVKLSELIVDELKKLLVKGITDKELEAAIQYKLGSFQKSGQTVSELMDWYSEDYLFDGTILSLMNYDSVIRGTKKSEIKSIAKEFAESNVWCLGVLGDISKGKANQLHLIFNDIFRKNGQ